MLVSRSKWLADPGALLRGRGLLLRGVVVLPQLRALTLSPVGTGLGRRQRLRLDFFGLNHSQNPQGTFCFLHQ